MLEDLPSDDEFEVELRRKEEVICWEGGRGFVMDAGWGVDPPVVHVLSAALWDRGVPPWLLGRHAEVMNRLVQQWKHVVQDTEDGDAADDGFRSVRR